MPALTLSTTTPKPGETITLTCSGYAAGESRTVAILLDGVEVDRFTTRSATATRQLKAPASGSHRIDANGMRGCAAALFTVQAVVTPPPPSSGVPVMPPGGDILAWDFGKEQSLGKLRPVYYLDGKPNDNMSWMTKYKNAPAGVVIWTPDYVGLRTFPDPADPNGKWWGVLLSTGDNGAGQGPTLTLDTCYIQYARQFLPIGKGAWPDPLWQRDDVVDVDGWTSDEIDEDEVLEDQKAHFNVYPPGKPTVKSVGGPIAVDTSWHVGGLAIAADHVQFTFDGQKLGGPVARPRGGINLLSDAKVGFKWAGIKPDPGTGPFGFNLAWLRISSAIPAGL